MSFNLFVYGSLKDPLMFNKVTGFYCLRKEKAILNEFEFSLPYKGYPVIRPKKGEAVIGEIVYDIPDEALEKLDTYEGGEDESAYRRETVTIQVNGEAVECYVYVGL
jgi:gamma-glutamylcyclotransferase (GGCT)/AIG2-like uncharacterized protein YtfP